MIGISEIKRVLPHRYPVLLVDRVLEAVPGERLVAVKAVTCNEPWYEAVGEGADYAYPPALVLESWCQAAAMLASWERPNPDVLSGQVMLGVGISGVRFAKRVLPGDLLEHRVHVVRALDGAAILGGGTVVRSPAGSSAVLEVGSFVMALRPAAALRPPRSSPPPALPSREPSPDSRPALV